jgi:phosphate:Na+ symporter
MTVMDSLSANDILMELLGAAALLLWGMRMVRTGVQRAFGAELRHFLRVSLRNRVAAFGAGLAVTGILQSSTATALVVASFAGRGLVETAPALAVMLGADVGTSLVAQVLSLKVHWLAPLLILIGVTVYLGAQASRYRELGRVAIGLGLMLLALRLLLAASVPMREATIMQELFGALTGTSLIAVLVAALLTWLAHSSLATVLLIMSLATAGALPLTTACVLVLGANLGGAIPAVTATLADTPAARRVPVGNLLFKLLGCLAAAPVIDLVVPLLTQLEAAPGRVVVNFHAGFNLALAAVCILLIGPVAKLCTRLLPDRPVELDPGRPRHLDRTTLDTPSLALACAAREALRMGDVVETMLRDSLDVLGRGDRQKLAWMSKLDDTVDKLHEAIKLFVTDVSREPLSPDESRRAAEILSFTTNLEHIGDIIDKSLLELAGKKIRKQLRFSEEGWRDIEAFHARILNNLQLALGVFMSDDLGIARKLIDEKVAVRDAELQAAENHLARLRAGRPESIDSSALHLDILRDLKRIHSHICAVAYPILDEAGQLHRSRLKRFDRQAMAEDQVEDAAAGDQPAVAAEDTPAVAIEHDRPATAPAPVAEPPEPSPRRRRAAGS